VVLCHVWDVLGVFVSVLASTVCCDVYCQQCCICVWSKGLLFDIGNNRTRGILLYLSMIYFVVVCGSFVTNWSIYL
jgi:hypothetical protein